MRSRKDRRPKRNVQRTEAANEVEETKVFQREEVQLPGRRQWLYVLGAVILAVLLFGGGAIIGFMRFATHPSDVLIPPEIQDEFQGRINILVMGIDGGVNGGSKSSPDGKRSDVLMVLSVDPDLQEVGVLSIPRDTRAFIPKEISDYQKIGHAHAYGGAQLAIDTVEMLLKIPIHHYVRVDFEGFVAVIDRLDGIDIDVPGDMYYKDPFQDLLINIPKGPQHLDGKTALGFVRYREYDMGDIDRIKAQELFLKALIQKAVKLRNVFKIPDLIADMQPYFSTSLTTQDLLYLSSVAMKMEPDDIKMGLLPGTPEDRLEGETKVSYWIHDSSGSEKMVDRLINGIDLERNAFIRVAVENGCGITGAADKLATVLRNEGFQVVSVGNAKRQDYLVTDVMAVSEKKGDLVLVHRGIKSICSQAQGLKAKDKDMPEEADVLVIIGKDFKMPIVGPGL